MLLGLLGEDDDEEYLQKLLLPLLSSESSEGMEGRREGGDFQQGC